LIDQTILELEKIFEIEEIDCEPPNMIPATFCSTCSNEFFSSDRILLDISFQFTFELKRQIIEDESFRRIYPHRVRWIVFWRLR
jgi:hypothetical protein